VGGRIPPLVSRFSSTTIDESCRVTPRNLPLSLAGFPRLFLLDPDRNIIEINGAPQL
jgi:hypothetical protein